MLGYVIHRVFAMLGVVIGVVIIMFVLTRVLPGSNIETLLGSRPTLEQIARVRADLGLDQPMMTQLLTYFGQVLRGDFGVSIATGQPVIEDISSRFLATLELVTLALILSLIIGVPVGILSAINDNGLLDNSIRLVTLAGFALPNFLLAILLQLVFFVYLDLLPLGQRIDDLIFIDNPFDDITGFYLIDPLLQGNFTAWASAVAHLVLPVLTLTLATLSSFVRITRNMVIETLARDHFKTMLAYRLDRRSLYGRYALKATFIPLLTVVGLVYGVLLGSSAIVESIFDWPGLGGYMISSLIHNDIPAFMGVTIVFALFYLAINLLIDLAYFFLDPRLRRGA